MSSDDLFAVKGNFFTMENFATIDRDDFIVARNAPDFIISRHSRCTELSRSVFYLFDK